MKKIIIDRKIWLHGKEQIDNTGNNRQKASMLHRPLDKKMCCIGIYLNQCGVTKKVLLGEYDATSLIDDDIKLPEEAEWLVTLGEYSPGNSFSNSSTDARRLMAINDSTANERTIKKIFAKHDVEIEFIDRG